MVSDLLEVFHMVFGGNKDHSLLVRLHHVPKEVEQQRRFVIHAQMKK